MIAKSDFKPVLDLCKYKLLYFESLSFKNLFLVQYQSIRSTSNSTSSAESKNGESELKCIIQIEKCNINSAHRNSTTPIECSLYANLSPIILTGGLCQEILSFKVYTFTKDRLGPIIKDIRQLYLIQRSLGGISIYLINSIGEHTFLDPENLKKSSHSFSVAIPDFKELKMRNRKLVGQTPTIYCLVKSEDDEIEQLTHIWIR